MDAIVLARQLLLFLHLLMFAVALSTVIQADLAILRGRLAEAGLAAASPGNVGAPQVASIPAGDGLGAALPWGHSRYLIAWLLGLWLTGLALIGLDTGFDPSVLAGKPKLLAKLSVVGLLSLNGLALHRLAFPVLQAGGAGVSAKGLRTCALLGAVSTVSWLFASFVGSARLIAPWMNYPAFMLLYALALGLGLAVSAAWVLPRLRRVFAATTVPAAAALATPAPAEPAAASAAPTPNLITS